MTHTTQYALKPCFNCGHAEEPSAKFCGHCGTSCGSALSTATAAALLGSPSNSFGTLPIYEVNGQSGGTYSNTTHSYAGTAQAMPPSMVAEHVAQPPITQILVPAIPKAIPAPPQVGRTNPLPDSSIPSFAHVNHSKPVNPELQQEAAKLMVLLARERLFLLMHWGIFATLNIVGFILSVKCYNEFIGDEMSKLMMAMTPFWCINAVAFACMIPIKGTRREISRLKERISYVKFKIDYGHLV